MKIQETLTYEDVLLKPAYSAITPDQAKTRTRLTKRISLKIPLISAAMDTVTESALAIAMARLGGMGVIHKNMSADLQTREVEKVKRFQSGMIVDPITITPDATLQDALHLMKTHSISGIPVVTRKTHRLTGILTHRDVRFAENPQTPVRKLMTSRKLVTVREECPREEAMHLLHKHRIEKLIVVNERRECVGLITVKDIERSKSYPNACSDQYGRMRVAAAIGTGEKEIIRAEKLVEAECDILIIDTAHGHSKAVLEQTTKIKKTFPEKDVIVGNIATSEGAKALIEHGADAIKIGIGPGSICTTRIIAGVGVPQLSAVFDIAEECRKHDIPTIADGGLRYSGDLAKAIAAGADCAMIGSLLAGTDEAPGEVILFKGRSYKTYRGMGSLGAMARGSADRYFQEQVAETHKFVPEGVEGRVPYKGPVSGVIYQLIGGLKASMGYTGNASIAEMQKNCHFIKITSSGLEESHIHDVLLISETPNYQRR